MSEPPMLIKLVNLAQADPWAARATCVRTGAMLSGWRPSYSGGRRRRPIGVGPSFWPGVENGTWELVVLGVER
jgi:hypothetical protein